jgi:hypothetical protein
MRNDKQWIDYTGPHWVTQRVLARRLEVSDRRIRQMEKMHILPEARLGRYHSPTCEQRYALYRVSVEAKVFSERGLVWRDFEVELESDGRHLESLMSAAMSETSTQEQIRAASVAWQTFWSDTRFMTVCWSKSEAERDFFLMLWKQKEDDGLRSLMGRGVEFLAEKNGLTFEEVESQLLTGCSADEAV